MTKEALTSNVRATKHPNVPAPRSKALVSATRSKSRPGRTLHRMSFKFKSTACSARLRKIRVHFETDHRKAYCEGSIIGARSASRGPSFPAVFLSQPVALGLALVTSVLGDCVIVPNRLRQFCPDRGLSESLQHNTLNESDPFVEDSEDSRWARYARRLRRGHPGF